MNNMCIGVAAALVGSVLTAAEARLTGSGTVTNDGGSPLQALVWYACLFGGDPREVTYAPEKLDPRRAAVMRECAASVTRGARP